MRNAVALALSLLVVSACSHRQSRTAAATAGKPRAPQAVAVAMERQVRNALDAGEGDLLIRNLRQKVAAEPDNAQARYELADLYQKQGAFELAIEHLRIAAERNASDSGDAARKLARALRANDQAMDAIRILAAFAETHANAPAALCEELALLEDEAGALGEGERFHRRAITADTRDDRLRNNLGYNFLQQGKYGDAAHEFRAALQLNPASEAARNNLGFALARLGKADEAVLQWSSLSGPAAAHNNLAAVRIEQGDFSGARQEIQVALQYDRHNAAALRNLQLVSELDGHAPSFTMKSNEPPQQPKGWAKWTSALGRFFKGPAPASAAARQQPDNQETAANKRSVMEKD